MAMTLYRRNQMRELRTGQKSDFDAAFALNAIACAIFLAALLGMATLGPDFINSFFGGR